METGEQHIKTKENRVLQTAEKLLEDRDRFLVIMKRANEIAGKADLSSILEGLLDLMIEVTQAGSANFFQLDPAADELVITHVRGDAENQHLVGLRLKRHQGLPGLSFSDYQTIIVGDLHTDPDWLLAIDPETASRKRNVISMPIAYQQNPLGVVQIFNYKQADLDLLNTLGDRLALEMTHYAALESAWVSNQRLLSLVDVLGEVAGTLDRNQLLHLVAEKASQLVDAERSTVFLVNPDTRDMVFQVVYQSPGSKTSQNKPKLYRIPAAPAKAQPLTEVSQPGSPVQSSEFSYFNRSAITVPIHSDPLSQERMDQEGHILGGLLALNKRNAAFQEEDAQLLQILANQASTFLQVSEIVETTEELFLDVIRALAAAIDAKDPYTQGHSQRVSDYAVMISHILGLDETTINEIRIGSLLHDIGKIGIPDAILLKNGKLTSQEMETIKHHPSTGVNILSQVKLLEPMAPAILEHHERLDGSGYPKHLIAHEVSLMGRIVAVADVFDAMSTDRPYRPALKKTEVLDYLKANAGKLFDPICVRALGEILNVV